MRAIPMRGRVGDKRLRGYIWAGAGTSWTKKENYFQLESNKLVSACLASDLGQFWFRCKGATCQVTLRNKRGRVVSTMVLAFHRGRKK